MDLVLSYSPESSGSIFNSVPTPLGGRIEPGGETGPENVSYAYLIYASVHVSVFTLITLSSASAGSIVH